MIFNKKFIMYFSICLLVFNKQSLASAPVDVDSNSLASALELASVVEKQVESDKKKNEAVNKIGRAFKAHQAKSKLAKLKKEKAVKEAADKASKEAAVKEAKDKANKEKLEEIKSYVSKKLSDIQTGDEALDRLNKLYWIPEGLTYSEALEFYALTTTYGFINHDLNEKYLTYGIAIGIDRYKEYLGNYAKNISEGIRYKFR